MKLTILKMALAAAMALTLGIPGHASADQAGAPPSLPAPQRAARLIDATRAEKLIAAKKVVILDVRTPEEFNAGHIDGATNLDFHGKDFQTRLEHLDKDQAYLVHCAAGGRSAKAGALMTSLNFNMVYDLKGGLNAWQKAGKPVVKQPGSAGEK